MYIEGSQCYNFQKIVCHSLKIDFIFANSVDPNEMPCYEAFHPGLHCLSKCMLGVSCPQRVYLL